MSTNPGSNNHGIKRVEPPHWLVVGSDETVQKFSRDRRDEAVADAMARAAEALAKAGQDDGKRRRLRKRVKDLQRRLTHDSDANKSQSRQENQAGQRNRPGRKRRRNRNRQGNKQTGNNQRPYRPRRVINAQFRRKP
jgi:hypothetical protein